MIPRKYHVMMSRSEGSSHTQNRTSIWDSMPTTTTLRLRMRTRMYLLPWNTRNYRLSRCRLLKSMDFYLESDHQRTSLIAQGFSEGGKLHLRNGERRSSQKERLRIEVFVKRKSLSMRNGCLPPISLRRRRRNFLKRKLYVVLVIDENIKADIYI